MREKVGVPDNIVKMGKNMVNSTLGKVQQKVRLRNPPITPPRCGSPGAKGASMGRRIQARAYISPFRRKLLNLRQLTAANSGFSIGSGYAIEEVWEGDRLRLSGSSASARGVVMMRVSFWPALLAAAVLLAAGSAWAADPAPRRYVLMVQPSSMIYYDCASHRWLPGPASVVYYPAGGREAPEQPRPPVLPPPAPAAPPTPAPPPPAPAQESKAGGVEAGRVFWVGYRSYWQGDYDRALAGFDAAVRLDEQDARFWYYKALAERALGHVEAAEESARRGRELHAALKPKPELVDAALERVQGQERRFLDAPQVIASGDKNDR
jgi:tetratricopeptide (TPR) repeat protein